MPLVFVYGSLKHEAAQRETLGRRLESAPDALPGYKAALVAIDDTALVVRLGRTHHANVVRTGHPAARVDGLALEVTTAELARLDAYEAPFAYARVDVVLASGRPAWVYVHSPSGRRPA